MKFVWSALSSSLKWVIKIDMEVVYEDNHLIVVNKAAGEIVQGDKTGDKPLSEMVKDYLREKYNKPGNVFCGVIHRLDRPVCGLVVFAKTSKALARMNKLFQERSVQKTYWAISRNVPPKDKGILVDYLTPREHNNKTYVSHAPVDGAQKAVLDYTLLAETGYYCLLEVNLHTGRKHQIRAQLSSMGCPIRGDLKYGDRRSNPDGGISLQSHRLKFKHPVSKQVIDIVAPIPNDNLWKALAEIAVGQKKTNNMNNKKRLQIK